MVKINRQSPIRRLQLKLDPAKLMILFIMGFQTKAFAYNCNAQVPAACDILGTQTLPMAENGRFALTVDCKLTDGSVVKLIQTGWVTPTLLQAAMGPSLDTLPSLIKIQKRTDNRSILLLSCK